MTKRARFARIALALSLAMLAWFAIALFGAKLGMWRPLTAFATLTMVPALPLLAITGLMGAAALLTTLIRAPRTGWLAALIALAIPLAGFGWLGSLKANADSVPLIYDITTDTADPPTFSQAMQSKRSVYGANALNPFDVPLGQFDKWKDNAAIADKTAAELIRQGYPQLRPLVTEAAPARALAAARQAGWQEDQKPDVRYAVQTVQESAGRA